MTTFDDLFDRACAAHEGSDLEDARRLYMQCMAAAPTDSQAPQVLAAWQCYGLLLFHLEEWAACIEATTNALSRKHPHARKMAYELIALCYGKLGRLALEAEAIRQSLECDGQADSTQWCWLGSTLMELGEWDEAYPCLCESLRLDPNRDEAHFQLGRIYTHRKEFPLAETHLKQAIATDPHYFEAYAELGRMHFSRGIVSLRAGVDANHDMMESKRLLYRALELQPDYVLTRVYLAHTLWYLGKLKSAEEHFEAAVTIRPESSMTHSEHGNFLSRTGIDHARAGQLLRQAIALDPTNPVPHFYLGKHLLRCKRKHKAKAALQESARLGYDLAKSLLAQLDAAK